MTNVDLDAVIKLLEATLGIKLSKEQRSVLEYNDASKMLVNSCAGAGKTTLLEIACLVKIASGQLKSEDIIGVTFSHDARADMQRKFKSFTDKFKEPIAEPYFTTFHSLFYRLLQTLRAKDQKPRYHVLTTPFLIGTPLYRQVRNKNATRPDKIVLKDIFDLKSFFVNRERSLDGLNLHGKPFQFQATEKSYSIGGQMVHKDVFDNYGRVIEFYNAYKRRHQVIDFDDMTILLYRDIRQPKSKQLIQDFMKHYKMCFIDEFQDINSLQWSLMKDILPKWTFNHIIVVGDDDQSIYSFRGSDPDIILNFKHNYPDTRVFHLSTNYRTGGNILKSVTPLISDNKYRMDKKLLTNKKGHGHVVEFSSDYPKMTSGRLLLIQLQRDIKNPKIPNSQIAVLCRYNMYKMLAIDWLATIHEYPQASEGEILQNNTIYKTFRDIVKGLYLDKFSLIQHHAGQIGFRRYRKHIADVLARFHHKRVQKLSKYLKMAHDFDIANATTIKRDSFGKMLISDDTALTVTFRKVQEARKKKDRHMGTMLYNAFDNLTNAYYSFMVDHKYMDGMDYNGITGYIEDLLKDVSDIKKFFKNEKIKKQLLLNTNSHTIDVQIMTIHESKGLQFKDVFLYGLVADSKITKYRHEDDKFPPNISREDFASKAGDWAITSDGSVPFAHKELWQNLISSYTQFDEPVGPRLLHGLAEDEFKTKVAIKRTGAAKGHAVNWLWRIQHELDSLYRSVRKDTRILEEERRLIYVAVTRAMDHVFIDLEPGETPLIKELDVDKNYVLILDDHGDFITQAEYLKKKKKETGISTSQLLSIMSNLKNG